MIATTEQDYFAQFVGDTVAQPVSFFEFKALADTLQRRIATARIELRYSTVRMFDVKLGVDVDVPFPGNGVAFVETPHSHSGPLPFEEGDFSEPAAYLKVLLGIW